MHPFSKVIVRGAIFWYTRNMNEAEADKKISPGLLRARAYKKKYFRTILIGSIIFSILFLIFNFFNTYSKPSTNDSWGFPIIME